METGKQYFFTATIHKWQNLLNADKHKDIVVNEWKHQIRKGVMNMYGFVIMPNHYHSIVRFNGPKEPWQIVRDMHKFISRGLIDSMKNEAIFDLNEFKVDKADRKNGIWQRNPFAKELFDTKILEQKLDYIHRNPTQEKWKIVELPEKYKYSSAAYYQGEKCNFDFLTHYMD